MGRRLEQTLAATQGALVEGERVVASGDCWAAQLRQVPLLVLGRRQYVMLLTDRRLLLFRRRGRRPARPSDLVLGKRYGWFTLGRVRRAQPLLQVLVTTGNGSRMVFEFSPTQRDLARTLTAHLGDDTAVAGAEGEAPTGDPTQRSPGDNSMFWGSSTQSS